MIEKIEKEKILFCLIGINEYDSDLKQLPAAKENLFELEAIFKNQYNIPEDNFIIRNRIENKNKFLKDLNNRIKEKTFTHLVFYYAGHGCSNSDSLILSINESTSEDIHFTGISTKEIYENIIYDKTNGKLNITPVFILDCCFSTASFNGFKVGDYAILAASSQTAKYLHNERFSVFTNELISILENGIKGCKDYLSWNEINLKLDASLKEKDKQLKQSKAIQHYDSIVPEMIGGHATLNLPFFKNFAYKPGIEILSYCNFRKQKKEFEQIIKSPETVHPVFLNAKSKEEQCWLFHLLREKHFPECDLKKIDITQKFTFDKLESELKNYFCKNNSSDLTTEIIKALNLKNIIIRLDHFEKYLEPLRKNAKESFLQFIATLKQKAVEAGVKNKLIFFLLTDRESHSEEHFKTLSEIEFLKLETLTEWKDQEGQYYLKKFLDESEKRNEFSCYNFDEHSGIQCFVEQVLYCEFGKTSFTDFFYYLTEEFQIEGYYANIE